MGAAGLSIAIVDDDPPVLKSLRRFLRGRGFDVTTYQSAQEFLSSSADTSPDCLIVDLQMPGMTGLELHQHLRRIGTKIPTIVITALGDGDLAQRCLAAGACAFLSKPLDISLLLAAIDGQRSNSAS
jgi:FixJ family two-component response regulator